MNSQANKAKALVIIAVVLAFGGALYWQRTIIGNQQNQIKELGFQDSCAKQALEAFNSFLDPYESLGVIRAADSSYTSNYKNKLNKCFIETRVINGDEYINKTVSDANEGTIYGGYTSVTGSTPESPITTTTCFINPDGKPSSFQRCRTEGEFDDFVQTFMTN